MKPFEDRQYQIDAVDAWFETIDLEPTKRPIVAVPTGGGKTVIMGMLIKKYLAKNPYNRVVVLSHTREILSQDHDALAKIFPDQLIGLYSAGLGSKTIKQITVAGIQSVYRKTKEFEFTNLYIIDECHTVNHENEGMYRRFLGSMQGIIAGMSATVFRTGHGYVYENGGLFDTLAYDLTSIKNFNKLIDDGYLCNLISVAPETQLETDGLKKTGGDYNLKHMSHQLDREEITNAALDNVSVYSEKYKKWLVFAIDIDHADNICAELQRRGIKSDVLHSKIKVDRTEVIDNFKSGDTRALVSVGMVTTGFDAPNIDLIVLLRPTMSAVLHVQMVGRGLRTSPGKEHCLVLDFAGNTQRLGPINDVTVPKQRKGDGTGEAPMKTCPVCRTLLPTILRVCTSCGHEFVFKTNLSSELTYGELIAKEEKAVKRWLTVNSVQYNIHSKAGGHKSLLVTYHCGLQKIKDWVCLNHAYGTYPKTKADHWVKFRGYDGPLNTEAVFAENKSLKTATKILVDFSDKWPNIANATFD